MTAANAVALFAAFGGYLVYSKILTPADFALYAGALAISKFGAVLLDGGIKIALLKEGDSLGEGGYRSAFLACSLLYIGGTAVAAIVLGFLIGAEIMHFNTAIFLWMYAAAYFVTYPFLLIPLADLERNLQFVPVARAEGLSVCMEYGLPALLWFSVAPGLWSFIVSAWLARAVRVAMLLYPAANRSWIKSGVTADWAQLKLLFKVGVHFQLASVASMLRDSLHLLIIGPLYGREVAGMYAWVLQLCGMTSQIFVQTAARVSLPSLLTGDDIDRWQRTINQIVWLTILTFPPLTCLTFLAPPVNHHFFEDKWVPALVMIPLLISRMLPGLATTPLGAVLIAQRGTRRYAWANSIWTLAEVAAALACVAAFGSIGLALSYSCMAWFGLAVFAAKVHGSLAVRQTLKALLLRPSVYLALALALFHKLLPVPIRLDLAAGVLYAAFLCFICASAEPSVRDVVRRTVLWTRNSWLRS